MKAGDKVIIVHNSGNIFKIGEEVKFPFAGSGTECAMAIKEGRKAIGFDIEEKYCQMSNKRVQQILQTPSLFAGL